MSALDIQAGRSSTASPSCEACRRAVNARMLVSILGYPVGRLCPRCARLWQSIYDDARGKTMTEKYEARRFSSFDDRELLELGAALRRHADHLEGHGNAGSALVRLVSALEDEVSAELGMREG